MSPAEARLAHIELEIERLRSELGRLHVAVGDEVPQVGPRDSLRVARLKEGLARLVLERSRLRDRAGNQVGTAAPRDRLH
jgi:hypothetical protein